MGLHREAGHLGHPCPRAEVRLSSTGHPDPAVVVEMGALAPHAETCMCAAPWLSTGACLGVRRGGIPNPGRRGSLVCYTHHTRICGRTCHWGKAIQGVRTGIFLVHTYRLKRADAGAGSLRESCGSPLGRAWFATHNLPAVARRTSRAAGHFGQPSAEVRLLSGLIFLCVREAPEDPGGQPTGCI